MVYPITLTLPFSSPSQNDLQRWHWAKRRKYRVDMGLLIRMQVRARRYPRAQTPMVLEMLRVGPRCLDYGNLVGGFKPILDALVSEGMLVDDAPRWLQDRYQQLVQKRGRWTQMLLYPVASPDAP